MKEFIEILKVFFLGIIEGITEWLPISSTGHMILDDEFLKLNVSDGFKEMFLVVIQLGAILAVPIMFWDKLFPLSKKKTKEENNLIWQLWLKVIVGVIPAGILGVLLDDIFDKYLYNFITVGITLLVYGAAFILIEKIKGDKPARIDSVYDITYKDAAIIGCYQMLSLIPGTSRSGSTILGGMLTGVSRSASSEFSFFLAIPIMLGASLLKILKFMLEGFRASSFEIILLLIGITVSFAVSMVAIKFLMDFVRKHDFKPFGIYRIVLSLMVIGYFIIKSI